MGQDATWTRRRFLMGAGAAGMAAAAVGRRAGGGTRAAAERPAGPAAETVGRPNILWICTDQQRFDTIHALGNRHIRTPNLDALVESGVALTHAHCQSPICTPSRASFLTGMYPDTVHGCMNGNQRWGEAAPLVTATLAAAGYDCGLAGKLHLAGAQGRVEPRPKRDGYRVFHWSHHPKDDWPTGHAYADWLRKQGHTYGELKKARGYIPARLHQTTWCTDRAIEFLKRRRRGPWLFSLNCFDPHPPFDPPQEYVDRFDVDSLPGPRFRESDLAAQERLAGVPFQSKPARPDPRGGRLGQARYWAQIELIDENIGRLLAALDQTGQRDDTLVVFTSDHGDMTGDHGLRAKGCRFYDPLVRVPLIFNWPRRFKQAVRSEALVELTDVAPTLLEVAGLAVPEAMHGRSLLPILEGRADARRHREYVRSVYYHALAGPPTCATMIRTRRWKLVTYHGHDLGELFDMTEDPGEFANLWDSPRHADVRFDLLRKSFGATALAVDAGPPRISRF